MLCLQKKWSMKNPPEMLRRMMFRPARLSRVNSDRIVLFRRFLREDPGATYDLKTAFDVDPERDGELAAKRGFVNPQHFVKRSREEINQIRKVKHRKYQENGELVGVRVTNKDVPRVRLPCVGLDSSFTEVPLAQT